MRTKTFITALVVGALVQAMAVPSLAEANLWSERRMAARRHRDTSDRMGKGVLASLPAEESLGGIPFPLQPIVPLSLKTLSSSVSKNLPGEFQLQHEALLNAFPLTCGSVRKVTQPSVGQRTSKIVIHIQDVHQNEAAQRKIGHAIEALVEKGQAGRIALEGAWGPVQINGLREFSRPDLLRTVADYLLRVHKISGPIHSAITGAQAFPPILGVDDPAHYRANVAAYQRAEPHQRYFQESLVRFQADLDQRWKKKLNPPLLSFVQLTQSFHTEDVPLGTYLRAILPDAPKNAVGASLRLFQDVLELERRLDFKQVECEREKLLEGLVHRLDARDIEKLAQKSTAYRLGKIRYSEFYGDLQTLCIENGMDLHRTPEMEAYIRYILTVDKIDPERLFTEVRTLEKSILARLIKTPSEKRLVEEGTALGLAKKLVNFSLTTEEWNEYDSLMGESLSRYDLDLKDFEAFYQEAHARDAAMAENVLREMETNPSQPVVLVTGGFHSSGLADRLTRAGVTVVSFTPRIDKIDTAQGSAYLSVFSQEKTPLDSLFQGQKLFLATPPADTGEIPFLTATTAAAEQQKPASMSKIFANKYDEAARLLGFQNIKRVLPKIEIQRVPDGNRIITVHWRNNSYQVFLGQGKINNFRPAHPPLEGIWEKILSFIKRGVLRIINGFFPREIAEGKSELPHVDLTESGDLGFAKERLLSAFKKTRDQLIAQGRPDGRPYFPYLYESKEREFVIEADGIKIVLVDVAERADYDKPRRLSEFARHPRNIREGHPDDKCVFCRLMRNNSQEFFARIKGTGGNIYRATVNLGEYGYPHFQFISEDSVPNLYDRNNRFLDFLLSARALGPDYGVMINGPFSGASQRHLHFHEIKRKEGGLWDYIDSLSPPKEIGPSMREDLANYPGRPILFRGTSPAELDKEITKEISGLYDHQISAGVQARVKTDGTFEVVVAPTRGEAMVVFDVILYGSDDDFEKHRTAVRNYNLFGILDPTFDPIAEGMGAALTPGAVPNILMELPEGFKTNREWQARTAKRLIQIFGDYNPKGILPEPRFQDTAEDAYPESRARLESVYQSFRPDLSKTELESFQGDALVVAQFVAGQKGDGELFVGGEALTQRLEEVIAGVRAILLSHRLVENDYVDLYERQVFHSSFFVLRRTSNAVAPQEDIDEAQRLAEKAFNNSMLYGLVFEGTVINNNSLVAIGFVDGTPRTPSLARDYFANRPEDGFEKKRSSIFGISLGRFKKPLPSGVLHEIEVYLKNQGSHESPLGHVWVDKVVVFTHRGPNIQKTPLQVHSIVPLGSSGGVNIGSGPSMNAGQAGTGLLAVDIGGTSIVAAVMDPEGKTIVSERIDTVKLEPAEFYRRVAELVLKVKGRAEEMGYSVSPQVGVGSPGRFGSEVGGRVIAGTSAPNLGPRPDSFKGVNPEALLSDKLPGMTVVVHNDAVAQMAGQLDQLLADPKNAELKGTTVAYIGPGTGLGGGFAVIDAQGQRSFPTDGHIYDLVISREGVNLPLTVADKTVVIQVGGMAEDVLSGRAVIELLRKMKTAVTDAGLPAVFTSVERPDGRILNDVLSGNNTDSHEYAIAQQIAQFEGQMLGRVMELIHLGQIEKWTADAEWPEAEKGQVKGIVNFLLGGSVPQGHLGQVMRQTALEYLAQKHPGVTFHIIDPVIDGKEAGLRGAASFVKPSMPVPTESALAENMEREVARFKQILEEAWSNATPIEVPGANRFLSALSDSNIPLYIASGAPKEIIEKGLAALGMDQIPPANRFGAPRPKSEIIAQAKQKTDGVVIMFGDAELDMTEAKKVEGVIGIQRRGLSKTQPISRAANFSVVDYSHMTWNKDHRSISFYDQKSKGEVTLNNVGAVVFDFDGTLVASDEIVGQSYVRFAKEYFGDQEGDDTVAEMAMAVWQSMDGLPAENIIAAISQHSRTRPLVASVGPLRVVGFFPSLASRKFYVEVPTLYQKGNENVDRLYLEAATALNLFGPDGRPDPTQLSMQNLPIGEGKPGAVFRDFILFNLAMEILFQSEARRRGIPFKTEAYAGISAGLITATAASGSLSIKDVAKLADYFWTNVLKEAHHVLREPVQYYTVYVSDPEGYGKKIAKSPLNGIVEVYHYVSPDSLQVLVPLSHIPSFAGFNQSIQGVRTEPIRGPTREFSHSARLTTARQRLEIFLEREGIFFQDPKIPILSNNGGTFLKSAEEVKSAILAIVDEPMKTDQTVKNLSTLNPDLLIEFGLGEKGRHILELNGSRIPCQSSGMDAETNDSLFSAMLKLSKERNPLISIPTLAQTPLTNRTWQYVRKHLGVSPSSENSRQMEFAFTSMWEFFFHWALPFFVISWIFTRFGVPVPDMWLIPLLAAILEPVFIGSHSLSDQGKDLSRLAHFLMAFYGSGGVLIAWGGWGIVVGVVLIIIGLGIHYHHDISRAPPSSSDDEEDPQGQNPGSETMASETALRSILSLPAPVDMKLRSATARFTFVASFDETTVRDHSAVTSKNSLLSMLDAYAKGGEGWKGDLGQAVQEENAGVWVVPVGADRKGAGALARACLSSRGRDTEIRFVAENEAVAFALRFWSFGRSRVQVRTVPGAFSSGRGNRRIFRLATAQEALARDVSLRSGRAWRIVVPEIIALDYSGLNENSPLWNAPVIFLDALLRTLPVPASSLRNLDNAATRLIKRMA